MSDAEHLVERLMLHSLAHPKDKGLVMEVVTEMVILEAKLERLRRALDALAADRDPSEWADELWHARSELEVKKH